MSLGQVILQVLWGFPCQYHSTNAEFISHRAADTVGPSAATAPTASVSHHPNNNNNICSLRDVPSRLVSW